jgi:hypothetical protein
MLPTVAAADEAAQQVRLQVVCMLSVFVVESGPMGAVCHFTVMMPAPAAALTRGH